MGAASRSPTHSLTTGVEILMIIQGHSSLTGGIWFIFRGASIAVIPLTRLCTIIVYAVFKGKAVPSAEYQ